MMNYVFPILLIVSFASAVATGNVAELSQSVVSGAEDAVSLLLRLISMLCLWGGIMEIGEQAGLTAMFSKFMYPIVALIFPRLRKEKYVLEAISMNITANVLGLGNAATPLGLEAMRRLQSVNDNTAFASDEMVVFVVMNTAAMHIIPTTVATMRGQYSSSDPMEIMPAAFLTSLCALMTAITVAKAGNKLGKRGGIKNAG